MNIAANSYRTFDFLHVWFVFEDLACLKWVKISSRSSLNVATLSHRSLTWFSVSCLHSYLRFEWLLVNEIQVLCFCSLKYVESIHCQLFCFYSYYVPDLSLIFLLLSSRSTLLKIPCVKLKTCSNVAQSCWRLLTNYLNHVPLSTPSLDSTNYQLCTTFSLLLSPKLISSVPKIPHFSSKHLKIQLTIAQSICQCRWWSFCQLPRLP